MLKLLCDRLGAGDERDCSEEEQDQCCELHIDYLMPFDFAENVTCSEREIDVQSSVCRVVDSRSSNPQRHEWAVSGPSLCHIRSNEHLRRTLVSLTLKIFRLRNHAHVKSLVALQV